MFVPSLDPKIVGNVIAEIRKNKKQILSIKKRGDVHLAVGLELRNIIFDICRDVFLKRC